MLDNMKLIEWPLLVLALIFQSAKLYLIYVTEVGLGYSSLFHYVSVESCLCIAISFLVGMFSLYKTTKENKQ